MACEVVVLSDHESDSCELHGASDPEVRDDGTISLCRSCASRLEDASEDCLPSATFGVAVPRAAQASVETARYAIAPAARRVVVDRSSPEAVAGVALEPDRRRGPGRKAPRRRDALGWASKTAGAGMRPTVYAIVTVLLLVALFVAEAWQRFTIQDRQIRDLYDRVRALESGTGTSIDMRPELEHAF